MHRRLSNQEWNAFEKLSGANTDNFECLWRAIVKCCYAGSGQFIQYKKHPGVEFTLSLTSAVKSLGTEGTVIGWQCKFFTSLRDGRTLSSTQRREIEKSLSETIEHCPEVKVWILCVPAKLSKRDVQWLSSKSTAAIKIECWDDDDLVEKIDMTPKGDLIRAAYFGDLILTADDLLSASRFAYESIKSRWLKDVHFCTDAEHKIRSLLFEPEARTDFIDAVKELSYLKQYFSRDCDEASVELRDSIESVETVASGLVDSMSAGEWFGIQELNEVSVKERHRFDEATRLLKRKKKSLAIVTQNVSGFIRKINSIAKDIFNDINVPSVAVVADAGCGKTHMSIALIENGSVNRSGGLLMLAKELAKDSDIDRLISKVYLQSGYSIKGLSELLMALNEYGERNKCRVPWVIDGLNESQDPSQWKDIISRISFLIQREYPRVLLIVTLRTGQCTTDDYWGCRSYFSDDKLYAYRNACIPDDVMCIDGRPPDGNELIDKYFEYFKIRYSGYVPRILGHPLPLRLYCETTNAERRHYVSPKSLPYDISDIFGSYCEEIARHMADNKSIRNRRTYSEYRSCIRNLGEFVWKAYDRAVPLESLYSVFPKVEGGWVSDWEYILSQEGLILVRPDWEDNNKKVFEITFDAFGGYIVADWLMSRPITWLKELLSSQDFSELISTRKHLLSEDILSFLTWLYTRVRTGEPLYNVVPKEIKDVVFCKSLDMDSTYITNQMRADFILHCKKKSSFAETCYDRVFSRGLNVNHPIDSKFLDEVLTPCGVAERDRSWGRWVYRNRERVYKRLSHILKNVAYIEDEYLPQVFLFIKWMLVSNVCSIRDRATHILVELGTQHPKIILEMISQAFGCNDSYVIERLAAAGYGILMRLNSSRMDDVLLDDGSNYVAIIIKDILGKCPRFQISNKLALDSMINSIALLQETLGASCPLVIRDFRFPYVSPGNPFRQYSKVNSEECFAVDDAIRMDFANYSLTSLIGERPYSTRGLRYKKIYSLIEQRMYDLGFRSRDFNDEDKQIAANRYRPDFDRDKLSVERFGKKYAWIAYHEMETVIMKKFYPYNRTYNFRVDPSFPSAPRQFPIKFDEDIFASTLGVEDWIVHGNLPLYEDLLECCLPEMGSEKWIMVLGAVERESEDKLKNCYTMINGFVAQKGMMSFLQENSKRLNELAAFQWHNVYLGESPWSKQLRYSSDDPHRNLSSVRPNRIKVLIGTDGKYRYYSWYDCPYEYFNFESCKSDENEGAAGYLLSHYIMTKLNMRVNPMSWEMIDQCGNIGAVYFKDRETYSTERHFLFIRKDLLLKYLHEEGGEFGWKISGERRMHYTEVDKHRDFYRQLGEDVASINKIVQYQPNESGERDSVSGIV